jgi:hypothetical protein
MEKKSAGFIMRTWRKLLRNSYMKQCLKYCNRLLSLVIFSVLLQWFCFSLLLAPVPPSFITLFLKTSTSNKVAIR